jgi:hypothetical protein
LTSRIVQHVLDRVHREASRCVLVGFCGRSLLFGTNSPDHLTWLRSYTEPQYRITGSDTAAPCDIISFEDSSFETEIRACLAALPGRAGTLYQNYPTEEFDLGGGWTAWSHASRPSIILRGPGRGRCITLGSPLDIESKLEPIRCMREMFTKQLEDDGLLVFHAGSVVISDRGVAVCGAKGAGKSTTVVSLVEAGAAFLSNDRSYIGVTDARLRIHPWPTTAAVGMGTIYHFPGLRAWMEQGGWSYELQERLSAKARHEYLSGLTAAQLAAVPDKLDLTSWELARSLGSTVAASAPLSCLVFPQIDLSVREPVLEAMEAQRAAGILQAQCFTPHDKGYPDWLGWRMQTDEELHARVRSLVDRITGEVPCVQLRFGDLRGDAAAWASREILRLTQSPRTTQLSR